MMAVREALMEITDECVEKEVDAVGLGCSKEAFTEHAEILEIIDDIGSSGDFRHSERNWQRFSFILDQYQEQPHLIDPHLESILCKIITIIRDENLDVDTKHFAFRYFYFVSKVRGYKVIARLLPHEISDLEPLLKFLESQRPSETVKWETHYGLLLWFSIVVKIPFHLQRFDSGASQPVMDRILEVCKNFLTSTSAAQDMACYLTSIYLTRPDVKELYLSNFCEWVHQTLVAETNVHFKKGVLLALAGIFKHGQRENLIDCAGLVLKSVLDVKFQRFELPIVKRPLIKLIQRIGLVFLKPRIAPWRYQRGSRSLVANLAASQGSKEPEKNIVQQEDVDDEDDDDVAEQVEVVIEEVLNALRDQNREVQYSAAKGIGRLTNRLSRCFADQVVESILDLFSLKESDMAWHGGCLALAELARRGLLLPQRLSQVLPLVEQAMLYDELRGNFSVGSAVRDAACYLCWAFARAYDPILLQPYVRQLAISLLITTVFDREVNCRRAAASAFQEHVGRQGTFPHGIDILTTCDYFAVGLRKNAYLHLSLFVSQYDEYRNYLIDHLVERKIMHWDPAIRLLTAQTLHKLAFLDPLYVQRIMMSPILDNCTHPDLHLRHGSILAAGEILNALCQVCERQELNCLGAEVKAKVWDVCVKMVDDRFLRSFGGDMMRVAVLRFMENCSVGHFPLDSAIIDRWLIVQRDCLAFADASVQQSAIGAVGAFITEYFADADASVRASILQRFISELASNNQQSRTGNALALGSMPKWILAANLSGAVHHLCTCAEITQSTAQWAEARKNALAALAQVITTVGVASSDGIDEDLLRQIFIVLMKGIDDYTVDSRGDIGAIVRESAMSALQAIIEFVCREKPSFLDPILMQSVLHAIVKQATEQIRRTRLLATNVFASLIYYDPPIPNIEQRQQLKSIIPLPPLDISMEKECFDLWIQVMHLQSYRKAVIAGFVSSIGSLTESLVKSASGPFLSHLRHLNAAGEIGQLEQIGDDIMDIFQSNFNNTRFMLYMFSFLDHVISSGCLDAIFPSISHRLFTLIRTEMTTGGKPLKLLLSSIDLYCHLLRGDEVTFTKCVAHLLTMLLSRFPRVRKITATKLYETLLTLTDASEQLLANQDEILTILSETDWDDDVDKLKPTKNRLRILFDTKPTD